MTSFGIFMTVVLLYIVHCLRYSWCTAARRFGRCLYFFLQTTDCHFADGFCVWLCNG